MNTPLSQELIEMARQDIQLRRQLAADHSLFNGYHPKMKALHDKNANRLSAIVDQYGWPGKSEVGAEAAHAAWLILQHAISHPELQRRCFPLLAAQVTTGEMEAVDVAMLEDRIRCFEGRPQRFGTQFDWDEYNEMSPLPMDDKSLVEARRKKIGLRPLEEETAAKRAEVTGSGELPPKDYQRYIADKNDWLKANGWRS
ncbi:MAG: hypothetical protein EOP04_23505 [Proteobacteria bacterium]|nr:MAG: hypothetical protein EOP04_23505 [Pseudomonadota bacterium]